MYEQPHPYKPLAPGDLVFVVRPHWHFGPVVADPLSKTMDRSENVNEGSCCLVVGYENDMCKVTVVFMNNLWVINGWLLRQPGEKPDDGIDAVLDLFTGPAISSCYTDMACTTLRHLRGLSCFVG